MKIEWLETDSDASVRAYHQKHEATSLCGIQNGTFWADKIKKLQDDPAASLELALANLPLPAAFREAAKAIRKLISQEKKAGGDWEPLLRLLYKLAAIWSFWIPYAPRLESTGCNVFDLIPGTVFNNFDMNYDSLGYANLKLLQKTDVKRMVSLWGEPSKHTTLHEKYKSVWDEYEDMAISNRDKLMAQFTSEMLDLVKGGDR